MADVFLSYKRDDRGRAKVIADAIAEHGYSVFYDANIEVGDAWNRRIEQEMAVAKCVAVLWSKHSSNVEVGEWVHNEARKGKERKILAPAIIDDCVIPIEFSGMQAADLKTWSGDPADPQWREFIQRIGVCVARPPVNLPGRPWRRRWVQLTAGVAVVALLAAGGFVAWQKFAPVAPAPVAAVVPPPVLKTPGNEAAAVLGSEWRTHLENHNCTLMQRWLDDTKAQFPDWELVTVAEGQRGRLCGTETVVTDSPDGPRAPSPPSPPPAPSAGPDFLASLKSASPAPLTDAQLAAGAARLMVEPAAIKALMHFQGGAQTGFTADGRPVINFETNIFSRLTGGKFDASNPDVSSKTFAANSYRKSQAERWQLLEEAYKLDADAALSATGWGRFRIMGMNYRTAGFDSVEAFARAQAESEEAQLRAFESFLAAKKLAEPLARLDWQTFARDFFGSTQFAGELARDYQAYKAGGTP